MNLSGLRMPWAILLRVYNHQLQALTQERRNLQGDPDYRRISNVVVLQQDCL